MEKPSIGFMGQGYVGKNYADDFEKRGFEVVRYALEEPYVGNKAHVAECDVVVIAVPTPTTPEGFDGSIVASVIALTKPGASIIIKSTVLPGTTQVLQEQYPDRALFFSPEFLVERTATQDAARPIMNIVGYVQEEHAPRARELLQLFPDSPHNAVMHATQAEMVKYAHNIHGYLRVVYTNLLFEAAQKLGVAWEPIGEAMDANPMLSPYYNTPVHKGGRGAGGNCFIKDFAAFRTWYEELALDDQNVAIFRALEEKNLALLRESQKNNEQLKQVYGESVQDDTL